MPSLSAATIEDIEARLRRYLQQKPGYGLPIFTSAGGSAATFRIRTDNGDRAIKVYDPTFLSGDFAEPERKRLELQRSLIGHDCPSLVRIFRVEEAAETAFVEMEFVSGRPLKDCLAEVPDQAISKLIIQLADAARYLEGRGIVHRDIKPENIFVSNDFEKLVLLDLGVARTIATPNDNDASATDHGRKRRFIATAQYSSPEYLFRLDEPSPELWKALSVYQCGAVLHDLINKRALFEREVALENRWLVARAVLTQAPRFDDGSPDRLPAQKALALRCLSKDMGTRLAIVSWDDFAFADSNDPLADLQDKLRRRSQAHGEVTELVALGKLQHDRGKCATEFLDEIRQKLIPVCGPSLPMRLERSESGVRHELQFTMAKGLCLSVVCEMTWLSGLADRTADMRLAAYLSRHGESVATPTQKNVVCSIAIDGDNGPLAGHVAGLIAKCLSHAMDVIESQPAADTALVGYDVVRHSLGP